MFVTTHETRDSLMIILCYSQLVVSIHYLAMEAILPMVSWPLFSDGWVLRQADRLERSKPWLQLWMSQAECGLERFHWLAGCLGVTLARKSPCSFLSNPPAGNMTIRSVVYSYLRSLACQFCIFKDWRSVRYIGKAFSAILQSSWLQPWPFLNCQVRIVTVALNLPGTPVACAGMVLVFSSLSLLRSAK